uniref:Uncharacterized protein n=2 Tax=Corethron hystrix TaxID=216773 RepID=A0A7S1FVL4_9STRA|mmetsp:Transcript_35501/g.82407  ORF Transcript_35501/g.82407 Transcript_35501/m.82407 type:complete len:649 (+) Transcript_35501:119-2065(+)
MTVESQWTAADVAESNLEDVKNIKPFSRVPSLFRRKRNEKKAPGHRKTYSTASASRSPSPVQRARSPTSRTGTPLTITGSVRKSPRKIRAVPLGLESKRTDDSSVFSLGSKSLPKKATSKPVKKPNGVEISKSSPSESEKSDPYEISKTFSSDSVTFMSVEKKDDLGVTITCVSEFKKDTRESPPVSHSKEETVGNVQEGQSEKETKSKDKDEIKVADESFFPAALTNFFAIGSSINSETSSVCGSQLTFLNTNELEKSFDKIAAGVVEIAEKKGDGKLSSEEKSKLHSDIMETIKVLTKHLQTFSPKQKMQSFFDKKSASKSVSNKNSENHTDADTVDNVSTAETTDITNITGNTENSQKKVDPGLTDCIQFYLSPKFGLSLYALYEGLQKVVDEKEKKNQGERALNKDEKNIEEIERKPEQAQQESIKKSEDEKRVPLDDNEEQKQAHLLNGIDQNVVPRNDEEQKNMHLDDNEDQKEVAVNSKQERKQVSFDDEAFKDRTETSSTGTDSSSDEDHTQTEVPVKTEEAKTHISACVAEENAVFGMIYSLHTYFDHTELDSVIKQMAEKPCAAYYSSDSDSDGNSSGNEAVLIEDLNSSPKVMKEEGTDLGCMELCVDHVDGVEYCSPIVNMGCTPCAEMKDAEIEL